MTRYIVELDLLGWVHDSDAAGDFASTAAMPNVVLRWKNITGDEMAVLYEKRAANFPDLRDIDQVRQYYSKDLRERDGAIISCDIVHLGSSSAVRLVSKFSKQGDTTTRFTAQLVVPTPQWTFALLIWSSDAGMTGFREATIFAEFANAAAKSDHPRLKPETEFAYDRYDPASRSNPSFLLSDAEQYDARFPDHPLSRVRKCLRREESKFRILQKASADLPRAGRKTGIGRLFSHAATKEGPRSSPEAPILETRRMDSSVGSPKEMIELLGTWTASDILLVATLRAAGQVIPSFAERQRSWLEVMNADFAKLADKTNDWNRRIQETKARAASIRQKLTPDTATAWLARLRHGGRWLILPGVEQRSTLSVFTSAAHVDDFLENRRIPADTVAMSLTDLFALFPELQGLNVVALEFNRCPRCSERHSSKLLSDFRGESDLLDGYVAMVATVEGMVEKNIGVSRGLADAADRLKGLQYTLWHIDPGAPAVHLEMAKIAAASGYTELVARCKQKLAKYAPEFLSLAPE